MRVDTAGVQAMADRWGASVRELDAAAARVGPGLSCHASAAAVNAAHAGIAVFVAVLGARVGARATHVVAADNRYLANETGAAHRLAAVVDPVLGV
ncbi:MAG: hypothetical protein JO106_18280 [Mycobacterium sp.]|nr:hypothetical protein [Mycobacterium sp.]